MIMPINDVVVKPFLKWTGGKGRLLNEIKKYYPFDDKNIDTYVEPFVGGGSVLFDILNTYKLNSYVICDNNFDLIDTYVMIRDDVESVIKILGELEHTFLSLDGEDRKNFYLQKREQFNNHLTLTHEKAALMIFLNKVCFNGLFRVNKNGLFNVPMGSYKNPKIYDDTNLRVISKLLRNVTIYAGSYEKTSWIINKHAFVYIDPPHRPITNTSNFTGYTTYKWDDDAQIKLAMFIESGNKKGAKILMSNSDPKNCDPNDNFFDELYRDYNISRVHTPRMINCKGNSRGKISELLISNFSITKDEHNEKR